MHIISQAEKDALSVELAKLYAVEKLRINDGFDAESFAKTYLDAKHTISTIINRASAPL